MATPRFLTEQSHRFVVTGGAGFIGSNLALELLNLGQKVRVVDSFATGKQSNIAELTEHARSETVRNKGGSFEFVEGDIRDDKMLATAFAGQDYVLHQAALGSVPRSIDDPWTSHHVNVDGTVQVFLAARKARVKRVVYASSSSVYGNSEVRPNKEGFEAEPLSPYAVTKKINELYARNFAKVFGLPVIGLRYFNVFGPRQDPQSRYAAVVPKFITSFMNDESPTINGDGETSRDFTFVKNVVLANFLACAAPTELSGEVFNVACSQTHTLNAMVETLRQVSGKAIQAKHAPERPGDIRFSQANIEKAQRLLAYQPQVTFADGMAETYRWFLKNRSSL